MPLSEERAREIWSYYCAAELSKPHNIINPSWIVRELLLAWAYEVSQKEKLRFKETWSGDYDARLNWTDDQWYQAVLTRMGMMG